MQNSASRLFAARLPGRVFFPGDEAYKNATSPKNAVPAQRPLCVVRATSAADVAGAVALAAEAGCTVLVQATGHGAGRSIGDDVVLLDTSALTDIAVDVERRIVRCGAGATFGAINAAAFQHGLLAPSGSAPDVAAVGYVSFGGVGWLTRPHGLASAALLSVDLVDGTGESVTIGHDRYADALWAYRGGGGVGVATALELRLFPARALWAGYALWPIEHIAALASAWGAALDQIDPAVSSALGVLRAPAAPFIPEELRGKHVVHLSAATVDGEFAMRALTAALATLPAPAAQTFGPCDAARLATIHLDPPAALPAWGEGRWLRATAGAHALDILTAGGIDASAPLGEVELRHLEAPSSRVDGALTSCPGAFVLHATGEGGDAGSRSRTQAALDAVLTAATHDDTGRGAGAFRDGHDAALDDLPLDVQRRLKTIRDAIDPDYRIVPSRRLY